MAADAALKRATYEDLLALPPNVKGEILDGVLYTQPQPLPRHVLGAASVQEQIGPPFRRGIGGPGGWWILPELGINLPDSPEVIPDLAGWRRERLPELPSNESIKVVPDWVCEIFSPSTRGYDQVVKQPFYARHGVRWLWFIDPEARALLAYRLENGRWVSIGTWGNDDRARIEPFDAIEIDLSDLWLPAKADMDSQPPHPGPAHMRTATILGGHLSSPFDSGWRGPGGWWILIRPGIELPDAPEVVPDVAGWRRDRLPHPPEEAVTVVPDWVCEILSPSTRNYDQRIKKPFYAKHGVTWCWLVDPEAHVLTAHRLRSGRWHDLGTWADDERPRIEPFDAIEFPLSDLWLPSDA